MRTLYFDCFSGAAGDMILGALIDLGVPLDGVRSALGSLEIAADAVWTERVMRAGLGATKFWVAGEEARLRQRDARADAAHDHADEGRGRQHDSSGTAHSHASGGSYQGHRSLADVRTLIAASGLTGAGKARATALFNRLGEAEAAVHGVPVDRVHLHEVGSLDSIVDIVGTVFALDELGVEHVVASPLNVGGGMTRTSHGVYPVPAPATTRLLTGAPVYAGPQQVELVTPTGALLVTDYAKAFGPVPPMRLIGAGYGAGTRDLPGTPNVLRVLLGEMDDTAPIEHVVVIEANIDDMSPQLFGPLMDDLLASGALDVFLSPIQMKKNRPGTLVSVVAPPDARERLTALMFRDTTTIGVRYQSMARECLDRETVSVDTPLGPIRVKVATRQGRTLNVAPEFEDCLTAARAAGRAVKDVQALAMKAFYDRFDTLRD